MVKNNTKLRYFDAFPKVKHEYQQRTSTGGIFTAIVAILMIYLTISEFWDYLSLKQEFEFLVDRDKGSNRLQINVDLTVAMPCNYINVDVHDVSGNSIHMQNEIQTYPIHFDIKKAKLFGENIASQKEDDVDDLVRKGQYDKGAEFSKSEEESKTIDSCRISGSFEVNKVKGNFHITPQGHGHGGQHIPHSAFNFTHRIDKFSFGLHYPRLVNPLDNSFMLSNNIMDIYEYFISVVPTIYENNYGQVLITNQYAVTNHRSDNTVGSSTPGLFFQYNIEPILVKVKEQRIPFIQFLVRLCGIIGGVFTTAGFLRRGIAFIMRSGK